VRNPPVRAARGAAQTRTLLVAFAKRALADATAQWEQQVYPALVENALRQLIATTPDLQTA
jgi:hypothetical protein